MKLIVYFVSIANKAKIVDIYRLIRKKVITFIKLNNWHNKMYPPPKNEDFLYGYTGGGGGRTKKEVAK